MITYDPNTLDVILKCLRLHVGIGGRIEYSDGDPVEGVDGRPVLVHDVAGFVKDRSGELRVISTGVVDLLFVADLESERRGNAGPC